MALITIVLQKYSLNVLFNLLCSFSVECSRHLSSQLVRYICKTKKLERALKTKDVLCSSLADKLDVMREEKNLRDMTTDISNNRVNGGESGAYNGYSGTNELTCTREQARNTQNEGSNDIKNGGVISSNEEQVSKARFESVEKELKKVKEELNKVSSEKSQVSLIKLEL